MRLRLDWLIASVVVLAILSVLASVALLVVPWPFAATLPERSSLSQTVSTALALVLGTVAIIVAVGVERTDYRAQEAVRRDVAVLAATMHGAVLKAGLWMVSPSAPVDFAVEQQAVGDFLCSTTGFAFVCWTGERSRAATRTESPGEPWRVFLLHLVHFQHASGEDAARALTRGADDVLSCIEQLRDEDVRRIASYVQDLNGALLHYREANEVTAIVRAVRERSREAATRRTRALPSEDVIRQTLAAAERVGLGLAMELRSALREARAGDAGAIATFGAVSDRLLAPDPAGAESPAPPDALARMRRQYYFRPSPQGLLAWDVHRLVRLSRDLAVHEVPLSDIRELDEQVFGDDDPLTWRGLVAHVRLMDEVDPRHPIILAADGALMDGRHRVARALREGRATILAVRFAEDPPPDHVGRAPEELEY